MTTETTAARRKRRRRIALLVLLVILLLWWIPTPRTPVKPLQWTRAPGGAWQLDEPSAYTGNPWFNAELSGVSSQSNTGRSAAVSRRTAARFAARHVALFNDSDHPLMRAVASRIIDALKQMPFVQRIDYYPPHGAPAAGEASPDVVLRLRTPQLSAT